MCAQSLGSRQATREKGSLAKLVAMQSTARDTYCGVSVRSRPAIVNSSCCRSTNGRADLADCGEDPLSPRCVSICVVIEGLRGYIIPNREVYRLDQHRVGSCYWLQLVKVLQLVLRVLLCKR